MILVVDNTQNSRGSYFAKVIRFLRERGVRYTVVQSLAGLARVDAAAVRGVILTGSPLMPTATDMGTHPEQFMLNIRALEDYGVPVLGICFGCQFINLYFGGRMTRLRSLFCEDADVRVGKAMNLQARFCLNYLIAAVAPDLDVIGTATVRGHRATPVFLRHRHRPILGCLFHPEFHEATQRAVLDGFLSLCGASKM